MLIEEPNLSDFISKEANFYMTLQCLISYLLWIADTIFLMFSGKEYEVVSSAAEQKATVFVSSASGTKIGTLETYHIKNLLGIY